MMNTVVIVDESKTILNNYARMLEACKEEFNCKYFKYPEEAVNYIRENGAAVVVCELEMPVMSGKEVFDMVEMISPTTVKIAMSKVTDVRETLEIVNQSRIFKLILKPFFFPEDIAEPIKAALKYYELQKKDTNQTESTKVEMDVPDEKTKKLVNELETKKQIYNDISKTMLGIIENNLENGKIEISQEEKSEILQMFEELFREFMRYYMFGAQNYIFHINYLMNLFHHPKEKCVFQMKNNISQEIPNEIFREIAYTIFMAGYVYRENFKTYQVNVLIEETTAEYVLQLILKISEKDKNISEKVVEVMMQMLQKVIDTFAERTEKQASGNLLAVKLYYKKEEGV